jgi:hypothetical protein
MAQQPETVMPEGISPSPFMRMVQAAHDDMQGPRKDPFAACIDEACSATPTVRMSIGGVHVYACTTHARVVVSAS